MCKGTHFTFILCNFAAENMNIIRFLKNWTLPVAITVGALCYLTFYYVPQFFANERCGAVIDELGVYQFAVFVVQHHVGPVEVEHRNISQVDDVVGIAVDVVTIVVQIVERYIIH